MPLFLPQLPQPFMMADATSLTAGSGSLVAGRAFFISQVIYSATTFSQMRTFFFAAPTGNVDMGIYDATGGAAAPGNLLAHTGAIAATAGLFTKSLTSNVTLQPGQYWMAIVDTVADSIPIRVTSSAGLGAFAQTTSTALTVLPATAGTVTEASNVCLVNALVSGGFS